MTNPARRVIGEIVIMAAFLTPGCARSPGVGASEPAVDGYGGVIALRGKATGAFHVQEIAGRSMLVTPDGHGFLSLGVVHVGAIAEPSEANVFEKKYGRHWGKVADKALADFRAWGFNTAGYHCPRAMHERIPFMTDSYPVGTSYFLPREKFGYPDVFDPEVQERQRRAVRAMCAASKDNPRLIGYYWTDTPQWDLRRARETRKTDWVSAIRGLDASAPGKRRYAEFLKERYRSDFKAFRALYGVVKADSFQDLAQADFSQLDPEAPAIMADDNEFLRLIARELYRVVGEETRRCDPVHLVFGERYLAGDHPDAVLEEAAPYIDVLAVQPIDAAYDAARLERLHRLTGKPILLCDHQSSFPTPEHPKTVWPQLETEEAVGRAYEAFLHDAFSKPYILGYHRCQYIDRYIPNAGVLKQGLLAEDETPHAVLVQYTAKANRAEMRRFAALASGHAR